MKSAAVDPPPERRLAAILAAGIDRQTRPERDDNTHHRVSQELDNLRSAIREASGVLFFFAGDGIIAEFASATEALKCALRFQAASARRMGNTIEPIRFRMAVNTGEILVGKHHVGGAVISIAADVERIAPPGGIALPSGLHDQLRHSVVVPADPMGQPALENQAEPIVLVSISAGSCMAWAGDVGPKPSPAPLRRESDSRASLAVVPFRTMGDHAAFADAATNEVIRGFGGLATWLAVTRTPAAWINTPIDLHRVRQTSGARYILHGFVETERNMLRLTVELNEAETGRVLWSDRFDDKMDEQAALREDAALRIACAVPPLLFQRELDRTRLVPPERLTAHDLALHAFAAIMEPERDWFAAAADMLRQAEQRPGPHASTRFVTVWWHLMSISQGWSADPVADAATAAEIASQLDRNDPAAMALQAFMQSALHHDHELASALLDGVIDSAPVCALAGSLKSLTLSWLGDGEGAILRAEQAEAMPALGPERAWRDQVTALAHYVAGDYGNAVRWARVAAMHHPNLATNVRVLAASLAVLGRLDEAQQAAEQMLAIDPDFRIGTWRTRSLFREESRDVFAQRLRLAGLPG